MKTFEGLPVSNWTDLTQYKKGDRVFCVTPVAFVPVGTFQGMVDATTSLIQFDAMPPDHPVSFHGLVLPEESITSKGRLFRMVDIMYKKSTFELFNMFCDEDKEEEGGHYHIVAQQHGVTVSMQLEYWSTISHKCMPDLERVVRQNAFEDPSSPCVIINIIPFPIRSK